MYLNEGALYHELSRQRTGNRFRRSLRTVSLVEDILNAVETRVWPSTVTTTCISSELPCRSIVTVGWIEIYIYR